MAVGVEFGGAEGDVPCFEGLDYFHDGPALPAEAAVAEAEEQRWKQVQKQATA
jgi:hypothetical protein